MAGGQQRGERKAVTHSSARARPIRNARKELELKICGGKQWDGQDGARHGHGPGKHSDRTRLYPETAR